MIARLSRKLVSAVSVVLLLATGAGAQSKHATKQGFIPAGGFRVFYRQQGSGPAVLCLHAGLQNSDMWATQLKVLSKTHEVVAIDLPYHGRTTGTDTTTLVASLIKTVADSLGLQKLSVVGLSMGASAAQDFAIAYPDRLNKLVLMASGINGYDAHHPIDSVSMIWYKKYSAALKAGDTATAAKEFALGWGEGVNHQGQLTKPAAQAVYRTTLQTLRSKPAGWPKLQTSPPAYDRLGSIRVPTLVIHGDEDLPYILTTCAYLEKTIPGAKRVEVKGAAHMVNLEQPVKVNALLLDFLR